LDGAKKADIGASAKRQKSLQEDNYLDHARSVAIRMFPVASTLASQKESKPPVCSSNLQGEYLGDYDKPIL
jgi:phage/plasmid primase-like uncharacterized protein